MKKICKVQTNKSHYAPRPNYTDYTNESLKVVWSSQNWHQFAGDGRAFHRWGPATEKLLSPKWFCVRGTSHARMLAA